METTYLKKITKLQKKIEKIDSVFKFWFNDELWFFEINNLIKGVDKRLCIKYDEIEYLTFESIPFTYDGEERVKLVLREDDMRNLRESKK